MTEMVVTPEAVVPVTVFVEFKTVGTVGWPAQQKPLWVVACIPLPVLKVPVASAEKFAPTLAKAFKLVVWTTGSVSYTHLDVYKRQVVI